VAHEADPDHSLVIAERAKSSGQGPGGYPGAMPAGYEEPYVSGSEEPCDSHIEPHRDNKGATIMSEITNSSAVTVVLVHGAFADSSSWSGVIERLQADNVQVVAAANPLRGISVDAAYLASLFAQIPGPVLAVGHSYGGAVISNAATSASNVVGLVFVAAFAPDEGERLGEISATSTDSVLGSALVPHQYPTETGMATEFTIDPAKAREAFASDVSERDAAIIGTIQRPVSELAFGEPSGAPAWKTLPTWAVVATNDHAAGTDVVRAHAARAGAQITEVDGSHVIMISQPQVVADVIETAIAKVG
jgi:pimeloyl-ACP methyl ester carboxylesterase